MMKWDSALYDSKHDYVAAYGESLLSYVPHNPRQRILDLGCGTGTLTAQLAALGAEVLGIDSAPTMIAQAQKQYPSLHFQLCDALEMPFCGEWDVVFSNAVFHWIGDHGQLLRGVHRALRPGGLLICEFGAHGNIAMIEAAFANAMAQHGASYQSGFHFPTEAQFAADLTGTGFVIDQILAFDRPTQLRDGRQGLANFIRQFYASALSPLPTHVQEAVLRETEQLAQQLWDGTSWVADYRRLRAVAHSV